MVWSLTQKFVLVWALKRCHYPSLAETYAIRTIKYPWLEGWAIISRLNITILTVVTNNKRLLKVALFLSTDTTLSVGPLGRMTKRTLWEENA